MRLRSDVIASHAKVHQLEDNEIVREDEIDLALLAAPLIARWKPLLAIAVICSIVAFFCSRAFPKVYESKASLYVQQSSTTSSLLSKLPIAISGGGSNNGYFVTILQSDALRKMTMSRLKLLSNPHFVGNRPATEIDGLKALGKMVSVEESKNGAISVTVQARSPKLAANIANTLVDGLGRLVTTASARKSDFIEKRLQETARDMDKAEDDMCEFMQNNRVAAIDEQTQGMVAQLGQLDARLLDVDAQIQGINGNLASAGDLNDLVESEVQKKSLSKERDFVISERDKLNKQLENLPAVAVKYARIKRRVEVLNGTYQLLMEQYQMANIARKGEDGDYQIIDRAFPNPQKVAPSNLLNAIAGGMLGLFAASVVILFRARSTNRKHSPCSRRQRGPADHMDEVPVQHR
ncbi:MAG: GNVR domain-containing protein [Armatimonadota bacterium]|nr:hypothetical protein [bacterium]